MSNLADRLEQWLAMSGLSVGASGDTVREAIAALRSEPASGQLSAEDIEEIKFKISIWSMRPQPGTNAGIAWEKGCWQGVEWGMALSSLRGTFADGIEAAAKVCDSLNFPIDIDSWGAMTKHEISVLTCNECAITIRALAQDQRSEALGTGAWAIKGLYGIEANTVRDSAAECWSDWLTESELTRDVSEARGYRCVPVQVTEMVPSICPRCGDNKWADFYRGPVPIAKVCTNTQCNHKIYNEGYAPPKEPK